MINKYIARIIEECNGCYECDRRDEVIYIPFQSKYSKDELEQEYDNGLCIYPFKEYVLLDTEITIYNDRRLDEILTVQEWFSKYGTGVKAHNDKIQDNE